MVVIHVDVLYVVRYGETPLIVAIRSARPEMAKLLLSLGSDPRYILPPLSLSFQFQRQLIYPSVHGSIKSDAGSALELAKSVGLDDVVAELQGNTSISSPFDLHT